jgi:hypothetical protein
VLCRSLKIVNQRMRTGNSSEATSLRRYTFYRLSRVRPKTKINPGDTYGEWTVIKSDPKFPVVVGSKYYPAKVVCVCSCGEERSVYVHSLVSGSSHSCGQAQHKRTVHLEGKTIGNWHVEVKVDGELAWMCVCIVCGNRKKVRQSQLVNGSKPPKRCAKCPNKDKKKFIATPSIV